MPLHKIVVEEFECIKCGYKWINRSNGKDGPRPKRCAGCKCWEWDEGPITSEEKKLRRRLAYLESEEDRESYSRKLIRPGRITNDLCKQFLWVTHPRPTIQELKMIVGERKDSTRRELMREIVRLRTTGKHEEFRQRRKSKKVGRIEYLRNRLKSLESDYKGISSRGEQKRLPSDLCMRFLKLEPKPTQEELETVNYPLGIDTQLYVGCVPRDLSKDPFIAEKNLDSSTLIQLAHKWWNQGERQQDMEGWKEMCEQETQKRREIIQQIIDSRKQVNEAKKNKGSGRSKTS